MTPVTPVTDGSEQWMDAMSKVVGLDIPAASREGVAAQLALNHRLVAPLLAFEIPEGVMPAPRFQP